MSDNKDVLSGMSVNERLFVCGLLDDFDNAVRDRDLGRLREILKSVNVDELSISMIISEKIR